MQTAASKEKFAFFDMSHTSCWNNKYTIILIDVLFMGVAFFNLNCFFSFMAIIY